MENLENSEQNVLIFVTFIKICTLDSYKKITTKHSTFIFNTKHNLR